MDITINISEERLTALEHVVDGYNTSTSSSFRSMDGEVYVEKTIESYFSDRCNDLLDKYVKSYKSHLENNPDNLKLYSDAVKFKDNPVVAEALRDLIVAVNSVKEEQP